MKQTTSRSKPARSTLVIRTGVKAGLASSTRGGATSVETPNLVITLAESH